LSSDPGSLTINNNVEGRDALVRPKPRRAQPYSRDALAVKFARYCRVKPPNRIVRDLGRPLSFFLADGQGDLSQVLELNRQVLNHLAKSLSRERIDRPRCQSTGLGQLPLQFFALPVVRFTTADGTADLLKCSHRVSQGVNFPFIWRVPVW
jgi:hypothetical protein